MKRIHFKIFCAAGAAIALLLFAPSCGDSPQYSNGDAEAALEDGEGSEQDIGADPCSHIDCYPGVCQRFNGEALCDCPTGYVVENKTRCRGINEEGDGDQAHTETDTEPEKDIEGETEIEESGCGVFKPGDPFSGLCPCDYSKNNFPCLVNMPFTYTNEEGEFRIGPEGSTGLFGKEIWNEWIAFYFYNINQNDIIGPSGIFVHNYVKNQTAQLSPVEIANFDVSIRNGRVIWTEKGEPGIDNLVQVTLDRFERTLLSKGPTRKFDVELPDDGKVFWRGRLNSEPEGNNQVYSLDISRSETRIDKSGTAVYIITAENDTLIYLNDYKQLYAIALSSGQEQLLISQDSYIVSAKLSNKILYYSDLSLTTSTQYDCGISIWKYDMESGNKSVIKTAPGNHDYGIEDVWENWMVFDTCDEPQPEDKNTCCLYGSGNADVYLRYIPTGEEWNLSKQAGDQRLSRIWDHLVIWLDSRKQDNYTYPVNDLYGIDLCKHPQLKDRFPSCLKEKRK